MNNYKETKPIVFCNIGWCNYYFGDENDPLSSGGSYVQEHGSGNESLNFYPIILSEEGREDEETVFLGSFETKYTHDKQNQTHIEKIVGCNALRNDPVAEDVIVVWCAKNPKGQTCVVGWYQHAFVFRSYQVMPMDGEDGSEWERWFNVSCLYDDAVLLPPEVRKQAQWAVPRHNSKNAVPFGFGQANIWYASEPEAQDFVKRMIYQIENYTGEDIKCAIE